MSESSASTPALPNDGLDRGFTFVEIVIVTAVIGIMVAVMSTSIMVTMRQQSSTEGRLNVARAEQNIGMWMPADLASAEQVNTDPGLSPCGAPVCDGIDLSTASNVLTLTWTDSRGGSPIRTNVSYLFIEVAAGEFELWRVECAGADCSRSTLLTELPGPPGGEAFIPGVAHGTACSAPIDAIACTRPGWVLMVSEPLAPEATDDDDVVESESERKNANRVIVTINGGGGASGAGGGVNEVSITAGGTVRGELPTDGLQGAPTFSEARSRCGGAVTLVIDESSSIGPAIRDVRAGVRTFVEALAGTPIQLQLVRFARNAAIVGSSDWHRYHDMTNEADVTKLLQAVEGLNARGGTNWEEGLFRTFYEQDGTVANVLPDTVVFFTDGVPTFDRLVHRTGVLPDRPAPPGPQWPTSQGTGYSQVAFDRANHIAALFRGDVRMIGVGVGAGIAQNRTSEWIVDPGAPFVWQWERGYRRYQQVGESYETNLDFEAGTDPESRVDFERRRRGSWRNTDPATYYANNTTDDGSDGWRINGTRRWYNVSQRTFDDHAALRPDDWKYDDWDDIPAAAYAAANSTPDWRDGFRIDGTRRWEAVGGQLFAANDSTDDDSDGWRRVADQAVWVGKAEYDANNTTPDASDGWFDTGVEDWVSAGKALDWADWEGPRPGKRNQHRKTKRYGTAGPYDGYDDAVTATTQNQTLLARLIAGNDHGTPAIWGGSEYSNVEVADMYVEPDWARFPRAMRAIALGECGGTLTVRTNLSSGAPAADSFRYQNTEVRDAAGQPIAIEPSTVTTGRIQPTGTFDFAIADGGHIEAVIVPQNSSELSGYTNGSWSCATGLQARESDTVPIADGWDGVRVRVGANEAVSCTFTVDE